MKLERIKPEITFRKLSRTQSDTFEIFVRYFGYDLEALQKLSPKELAAEAVEFSEIFHEHMKENEQFIERSKLAQGFISHVKGGAIE